MQRQAEDWETTAIKADWDAAHNEHQAPRRSIDVLRKPYQLPSRLLLLNTRHPFKDQIFPPSSASTKTTT